MSGDEKRYAIANNLIHFADNMVASSMESHNGAATEVDLKEAEVFKNLAEKLIK